ncbi:NAD(P)-binding protein [Coprinellus micaceus]|uniref:NAD(P)-binding protein n=1 Tax=Coprinellus micaceus TaxID=71717 RepID=A0A4Y7TTS1_COPMI|nr:NAD(P)-binding protein [Coprinellus micaceus]
MKRGFLAFVSEHLQAPPPVVTADLTGQTVMVTGANTGLGFEAAKHFARMNPARLILACRNETKGNAAISKLKQETGFKAVELWLLDLAKFSSVTEFADRFEKDGGRLDILVANAAVAATEYRETVDGYEESLQVNNISTSLLCLRLAPRLVETAKQHPGNRPRIVVVSSEVHYWRTIPESVYNTHSPFQTLGSQEFCTQKEMGDRYVITKLLNLFFTHSLQELLDDTPVIVDTVNPGYCYSELRREIKVGFMAIVDWLMEKALARSTEGGSRQLVYAAVGGAEDPDKLKGAYLNIHRIDEPNDTLLGEEGKRRRDILWHDLVKELSKADPRVLDIVKEYSH